MSDTVLMAVIASIPPTIASILSWLSSRRNATKIEQIHVSVNSRMDELLKASKGEATATGHAAGMKEQKETNDRA